MVDLIPRSVLFGNPERIQPRISPDGGSLAWIAPKDGVLNVWVAPILARADPDTGVDGWGVDWAAARVVTADTDRGIRDVQLGARRPPPAVRAGRGRR